MIMRLNLEYQVKDQLEYMRKYVNTLMMLAKEAERRNDAGMKQRYARQGVEALVLYMRLLERYNEDVTSGWNVAG
jgi:hypothetical protein